METRDALPATPRVPERQAVLGVRRVGYLVPTHDFDGIVHSVFARACNVDCNGTLLTLAAPPGADGPTAFVLDASSSHDLRALFRRGERIARRGGVLRTSGVTIDIKAAAVWHPGRPKPRLPEPSIARNLRAVGTLLRRHRGSIPRARNPAGTLWRSALERACCEFDAMRAGTLAARAIGLGEGLTPSGDDFLVGLCAGLGVHDDGHVRGAQLRERLGAVLTSNCGRTTPIAAHFLRLAACGHFSAPLIRAREALLAESTPSRVRTAVEELLAVGASSGVATCAGLRSGLSAWLGSRARMSGAELR